MVTYRGKYYPLLYCFIIPLRGESQRSSQVAVLRGHRGDGSSSSRDSWRHRPRSLGPSTFTIVGSPGKEETVISSCDEENQQPERWPRLLVEVALTNEEFFLQMKIRMERLLHRMGPVLPLPAHVKEEPASSPRVRVKREPLSSLRWVN